MLKVILGVLGAIVALIGVGMFFANQDANNRYYYLSVVNTSADVATITVSLSQQKITLEPNTAQTYKIEGQKDSDAKMPRQISINAGPIKETLEATVLYSGNLVVDVTGNSCIVAADYGRQYRGPDVMLPEGESDLLVSQIIQGQRVFEAPIFKAADGGYEVSAATRLGEKLPDKIEARNGVMPTHGRLTHVPCDMIADRLALYDYLNVN